jgi:hypothetical protein
MEGPVCHAERAMQALFIQRTAKEEYHHVRHNFPHRLGELEKISVRDLD